MWIKGFEAINSDELWIMLLFYDRKPSSAVCVHMVSKGVYVWVWVCVCVCECVFVCVYASVGVTAESLSTLLCVGKNRTVPMLPLDGTNASTSHCAPRCSSLKALFYT